MKPNARVKEAKLAVQTRIIPVRVTSDFKAKLEETASRMQISVSEFIRRRCESKDMPPPDGETQRLLVIAINSIYSLSRSIKTDGAISDQHVRFLERLNDLANKLKE